MMHRNVSHNQVYNKFKDFKNAVFHFLDRSISLIFDVLEIRITGIMNCDGCG